MGLGMLQSVSQQMEGFSVLFPFNFGCGVLKTSPQAPNELQEFFRTLVPLILGNLVFLCF